jgi:hypothetical protein
MDGEEMTGQKGEDMHRMHRLIVTLGIAIVATTVFAAKAPAALLHPNDSSAFPDLSSGFVSGTIHYTANGGSLVVANTPYALATGPAANQSTDISANSSGQRLQTIVANINSDGSLASGNNVYDLQGAVTINGQTYNGNLLHGNVVGFGSLNTAAPGNGGLVGTSAFDFDVKITGGLLASLFGTDTYVRLNAERWSTFNGSFTSDFSAGKVATNIRGFLPPANVPVPEPTTLVVLIAAGGAGLLVRHRRRIRRDDLETVA